jgi:hypothetical protein
MFEKVEQSIEITAEILYEAIATALADLQQDNWIGEIGQAFTTVTVVVQQPPVKHEVKMKDFLSMARTSRTLSGRGGAKAEAGENIGQSEPREDVTEKTKRARSLAASVTWSAQLLPVAYPDCPLDRSLPHNVRRCSSNGQQPSCRRRCQRVSVSDCRFSARQPEQLGFEVAHPSSCHVAVRFCM